MKEGTKEFLLIVTYWFIALFTLGHSYNRWTYLAGKPDDDPFVFLWSFFCSVVWPAYWSIILWR